MRVILTCICIFTISQTHSQGIKSILEKSIAELDKIETFQYTEISLGTAAFDTTNFVSKYLNKVIGVKNENDTIKGFNYYLYWIDTTKVSSIYDYDFNVELNWYSKKAELTDFSKYSDMRKDLYGPFYITAKTLFNLALTSNQADFEIKREDQDTLVFDILFKENRFEFNGKVVRKQGRKGYSSSIYTVWLDKKNYLPFKIYRKQGHHASIRRILKYEINKQSHIKINALESIPDNFTIREFGRGGKLPELTGTIAPDFKLLSVSDNSISLSDYRGKVVLLEFTSVGCGPCHFAIPELRKLYEEYRNKEFEMLSIEAYLINKKDALQRYVIKNDIDYPFLIGNKEVTDAYQVMGVPYFIVIDQNGTIREAKFGYIEKETIPNLKEVINDLNK